MKTPNAGFTLVEVIASLLIVGILGAIAGMGIVTGMRGYMQTKENAHLVQKAQVSMSRIGRELMELTDIIARDDGSDPWVIFDNPIGRQALAKVGDTLQLYSLPAGAGDLSGFTGDVIVDQVDSLTFTYHSGTDPTWVISDGIDMLSAVEVDVSLLRTEAGGATQPFSITVNPRNTKNFSGASANVEPYTAPQYQCFIATAVGAGTVTIYGYLIPLLALAAMAGLFNMIRFFPHRGRSFPRGKRSGTTHRSGRAGGIKSRTNQKGNVLVGLVVTMLLFAALGAGMVTMTGTSSTSQVIGNTSVRAYYVAESGFRYAASQYLNTNDGNNRYESRDEKNQILQTLDNRTYTLANDDGSFRLRIFPYYFSVLADANANATSLYTRFPGSQPTGFTLPPAGIIARIKIGQMVHTYGSYNSGTGQFTSIAPPLPENVYQNATVKLVGIPSGSAVVAQGGDLTLATASFFPQLQGRIKINGVAYGYTSCDYNTNTLQDLYQVDDPSASFNIAVDTTTDVVLDPYIQVRSIGTVSSGDLAATREVVYNTPLPEKPGTLEAVEFRDEFTDLSAWNTPTYGSFAIETVGGENVLAVTGVEPGFGILKASLIGFNWTSTPINFASTHRTAGYYLSYDSQVKIGFDTVPFPETGWGPEGSPIPKHFAAGLSFRLDENQNAYGLSFMRGCRDSVSHSTVDPPDRIDDDIVPEDDVKLVVLWQQTGDGSTRQWLAYSEVGLLFSEGAELEPPPGKWTADDDHPGDPLWARADNYAYSGIYSWSTSPTGTYTDPPAGETWNDTLTSESIDLSNATTAELTFRTRYRIYSCEDNGFVEISGDGGSNWVTLNDNISQHCGGSEPNDSSEARYTSNSEDLSGEINGWVKKSLNISSYAGNPNVRIRFRFERNPSIPATAGGSTISGSSRTSISMTPPCWCGSTKRHWSSSTAAAARSARTRSISMPGISSTSPTVPAAGSSCRRSSPPAAGPAVSAAGMLWLNNTSDADFSASLPLSVLKLSGSNLASVTDAAVRRISSRPSTGPRMASVRRPARTWPAYINTTKNA